MATNRFNEQDHPRDETGKFIDKGAGESSNAQGLQKEIPDMPNNSVVTESENPRKLLKDVPESGASSGAIDTLDPAQEKRRKKHSNTAYNKIRNDKYDIEKISKNTSYPYKVIEKIKNYLFVDSHDLIDGYRPFHSDFRIAQSWGRLRDGKKILNCDIILLEHELYEMKLKKEHPDWDHNKAHAEASKKYNFNLAWEEEVKNGNIKENRKKR